ncbi:baseplate assembly protein [Acetobacteraceae bacterium KSS8]|uniref:Baseplate assembly protein n=1 Tax=Endosaccharibacter trunci TaxID=2812733 RepID=A0ABT1WAC9_9PROT|nr:baseplate assembly protein [Acetobacteraceae bacterium KSS8]
MNAFARYQSSGQAARIGQTRDGVVIAVDPIAHAVRVRLEPDGQETGWIPSAPVAAGGLRVSCPLEVGTQVSVYPTGGDIECGTAAPRAFDVHVTPPVSPATGKQAQPGELLAMAGQGTGPTQDGGSVAAATQNAAWFHLTPGAFYAGAGSAVLTIENGTIVATVAGCTMTLSASGLAVTGGTITSDTDVLADGISGKSHRHSGVQTGNGVTGVPQ